MDHAPARSTGSHPSPQSIRRTNLLMLGALVVFAAVLALLALGTPDRHGTVRDVDYFVAGWRFHLPWSGTAGPGYGGELAIVGDGCLGFKGGDADAEWVAVWERGTEVTQRAGEIRVRTPDGGEFSLGTELEMGLATGEQPSSAVRDACGQGIRTRRVVEVDTAPWARR